MKLGITEVKRRFAVNSNTYNLMVVLDQHLRKDCSDAEKLATIDSFMRGWMSMAEMEMAELSEKLSSDRFTVA